MRCPNCGQENRPGARFCSRCQAVLSGGSEATLALGRTMNNGQYRILKQLGKGGMGAIYLAANTQAFDRPAVIKEMLVYYQPGEEQDALARFEREAKTLASLKHPGIPDMYGYFTEAGHNYIVMEYIEGENLSQGLTTEDDNGNIIVGKPLPLTDALRYGTEVCRVLEYLASITPEPFVHNDIKPENVIIDRNSGQAVLVDFGTAKVRYAVDSGGQVGVKKSDVYGTVGYAPPEQYQGRSEPRSDVYALAATMYHLLTDDDPRNHPFKFPKLEQIPAGLRLVLEKALATEVEERLTATEFRRQLEAVRAGYAGTVQPLVYPEGDVATTVTGLLDLSLKHWNYARSILYDGSLDAWLRNSLYNPIAAEQAKGAIKRYPEEADAGLDAFLRTLNPRLPKPQLRVLEQELDFGNVELGETKELTLSLVNTGTVGAHGEMQSIAPWLLPSSPTFGVGPRERKNLTIRVANTGALTPGQRYSDTLTLLPVEGAPIRVGVRLRIISATPTQRLQAPGKVAPRPGTQTLPATPTVVRPPRARNPWLAPLLPLLIIALIAAGAYYLFGRDLFVSGGYEEGLLALQQDNWSQAQRLLGRVDPRDENAVAEVGRALDGQRRVVPAGTLLMGRDDGPTDERPAHSVSLDAFSMARFELTNVQYQRYVNSTGRPAPRGWQGGYFPSGQALYPVVHVSWEDATAYAAWLSQELGRTVRLPTEAEWEWAARGAAGSLYPWGNDDQKNCRNADRTRRGPVAVGSYPCGATPSGIMDLAGNVREWTRDVYGPYRDPHAPPASGNRKAIRGGSWDVFTVTSTGRETADANFASDDLGFRLVEVQP